MYSTILVTHSLTYLLLVCQLQYELLIWKGGCAWLCCAALRCSELDWTGLYGTGRGGAAVQQLARVGRVFSTWPAARARVSPCHPNDPIPPISSSSQPPASSLLLPFPSLPFLPSASLPFPLRRSRQSYHFAPAHRRQETKTLHSLQEASVPCGASL